MAAMDEFREERERIKQADLKTKIQYFLDYYKWHTIIGISVIVLVVSLIYSMVTNKEDAFTGYFINSQASLMTDFDLTNELASSFAENAGIDLNEYEVFIDSSLGYNVGGTDESSVLTAQRLSVTVAGQDTDFIAADTNTFSELFHLGGFYDLRDIYSEQDLKKYNDYLYYVDMEVIRQQEAILETGSMDFYYRNMITMHLKT